MESPSGSEESFGKYRLLRRLGSGGMAEVYLAELAGPEGFQKLVALKRILPELGSDEDFISSFISEARLGGSLNHPNIVQTLELGREQGQYFLAMEYVNGITLNQLIHHRAERGAMIPLSVVVDVARQLCDALAYAHSATDARGKPLHMVHRDMKPDNVLVGEHGSAKITDFGVARANTNLKRTVNQNVIKGTIAYMSPEQAQGMPIDHRSDLYSLGAILFELATLEPLYPDAAGFAGLHRVQTGDVSERLKLLDVHPHAFKQALTRLLASVPELRHSSAAELKRELMAMATTIPTSLFDLSELVHETLAARAARPDTWTMSFSDPSEQRGSQPTLGQSNSLRQGETLAAIPSDLGRIPSELERLRDSAASATSSGGSLPPDQARQETLLMDSSSARPSNPQLETLRLNTKEGESGSGKVALQAVSTPSPVLKPLGAAAHPTASPPSARLEGERPVRTAANKILPMAGVLTLLALVAGIFWIRSTRVETVTLDPVDTASGARGPTETTAGARGPTTADAPGAGTSGVPLPAPGDPPPAGRSDAPAATTGGPDSATSAGATSAGATSAGATSAGALSAGATSAGATVSNQVPGDATMASSSSGTRPIPSGTGAAPAQAAPAQAAPVQAAPAQAAPVQAAPAQAAPAQAAPVQAAPAQAAPAQAAPAQAAPAFITVTSRPFSYVYVNGRKLSDPTPLLDVQVPSGKVRIELRTEDGRKHGPLSVTLKPGEHKQLPPVVFE